VYDTGIPVVHLNTSSLPFLNKSPINETDPNAHIFIPNSSSQPHQTGITPSASLAQMPTNIINNVSANPLLTNTNQTISSAYVSNINSASFLNSPPPVSSFSTETSLNTGAL
jgi:hypothetical protein